MKIEIYRNGEYFSTHHMEHMTRTFSAQACEAREVIVEQQVALLRSQIRRVVGSDMGFAFVLVAQSILSNATEMQAWKERKQREQMKAGQTQTSKQLNHA
jgi:hypothetical protein